MKGGSQLCFYRIILQRARTEQIVCKVISS